MSNKTGPVSDGWCGACGKLFQDRPDNGDNTCEHCGASLAPVPTDQAVAAFKTEFVKTDSLVLDGWYDEASGFLVIHVNGLQMTDRLVEFQALPKGVYMGLPTVITLFPREQHC